MTFCNKALHYRKLLNSASQNKRTTTSLRFCNDKCEAVKAQVWKSQGTTVTQELSRQHRKLSDNSNETYRREGQAINAGKVKQPNDVRARAVAVSNKTGNKATFCIGTCSSSRSYSCIK